MMQAFGFNIRYVKVIADNHTDCRDEFFFIDDEGTHVLVVDYDNDEVRVLDEGSWIKVRFDIFCGNYTNQYVLVNTSGESTEFVRHYAIDYGERRLNVGRVHYEDNAL